MDRVAMELLRPAADYLRRALQRMEEQDIPAALRPLADSSARRLPPPLLKRALTELDSSEWLRAEVAVEAVMEPGSATELFVERPPDWEARFQNLIGRAAEADRRQEVSELEGRLAEALQRITELETAVKEGEADTAAAERRVRDRLKAQLEAAQHGRRQAEQRQREEAHRAARLASRVERLTAELEAAQTRTEQLRVLLEKERRATTDPATAGGGRGWFPHEPAAMAEELDRILVAVRRSPASPQPEQSRSPALVVPDGIRPDRVEMVHWLMRRSMRWLIDGYNVAFQLSSRPGADTRVRLVAAAGHLATVAAGGSMVVVVFDSSVDSASIPADRRVKVVFAPSADEWIVTQAGAGTAVVSSDRWVREESEKSGAIGVWSEALAAWIGSGGTVGS